MTAAGRPVMLGYFLETFLMTPAEGVRTRQHLLEFANREGYEMPAIFVEALDTSPTAIESLIDTVRRDSVTAIAITDPASLAEQHRRDLVDAGVRLLIATDPP